jgi:CBS domain-containing protein
MKSNVVFIPMTTSILEAAQVFVNRHVGLLPVVDQSNKPVGMVRLADMLSLELPAFLNLVADVDFVHDFGAVETTRPQPEVLAQPVTSLMQPVRTIEQDSGLLRTYALMLQRDLSDMPVVNESGQLVGIVSRVDIGTAVLSLWSTENGA